MLLSEWWNKFLGFILSWLPQSFTEAILFIVTVSIVIIIISLFHYTSIQMRVRKESRCYREAVLNRTGVGKYKVTAVNSNNGEKIYEVEYDFGAKTYTIHQVCTRGNTVVKLTIPVYDIQRRTTLMVDKYFDCEMSIDQSNIIYTGYPGLVRFMEYQNSDFFDKVIG
jgi:hypothetical protein